MPSFQSIAWKWLHQVHLHQRCYNSQHVPPQAPASAPLQLRLQHLAQAPIDSPFPACMSCLQEAIHLLLQRQPTLDATNNLQQVWFARMGSRCCPHQHYLSHGP